MTVQNLSTISTRLLFGSEGETELVKDILSYSKFNTVPWTSSVEDSTGVPMGEVIGVRVGLGRPYTRSKSVSEDYLSFLCLHYHKV